MNRIDSKKIYNRLKASAKSRGIDFSLKLSELNEISYPIRCPVLGIELGWNRGEVRDNSYSFDRIDSRIGYEIGNLRIISYRANRLKSDSSIDEIRAILEYMERESDNGIDSEIE